MTDDTRPAPWGYSDSGEECFYTASSREDAIARGADETEPGSTFYVLEGQWNRVDDYFPSVDRILELANESAGDDNHDETDWPDVSTEARAELEALLAVWKAKHLEPMALWHEAGSSTECFRVCFQCSVAKPEGEVEHKDAEGEAICVECAAAEADADDRAVLVAAPEATP